MTAIDCTDCYLAIEIGDGVKRALVRHFAAFIAAQLAAQAMSTQAAESLERIDREAWRLAARVLRDVRAEIDGAVDETLLAPDPQKSVQDMLAGAIEIAIGETEQRYLADDLFGLAGFVEKFAFGGAPQAR